LKITQEQGTSNIFITTEEVDNQGYEFGLREGKDLDREEVIKGILGEKE
jgi:hypothetical protein